jgi:hypothetical protein
LQDKLQQQQTLSLLLMLLTGCPAGMRCQQQ